MKKIATIAGERIMMRLLTLAIALSLTAVSYADIITMKDGRIINGTYLGGTARQVKVEVGDNIQTLDVGNIARIEFSNGGYTSSRDTTPPPDNGRPTLRRADSSSDSGSSSGGYGGSGSGGYGSGSSAPSSRPVILQPDPNDTGSYPSSGSSGSSLPADNSRPTLRRADSSSSSSSSSSDSTPTLQRPSSDSSSSSSSDDGRPILRRAAPDPAATTPAQVPDAPPVNIPAQTEIVVRMIDGVDSQTAKEGDLFRASLDQPIAVNGQTVVLRGSDAQVKLVQAQQSGKFTGKAELTLSLWTVTINGKLVPIDTENITKSSSSRGAQTAKVAGGAAAAGAAIGAIAGGGKGAAVGAGAGAAGGAVVEATTKGQRVKVPSETLLTFAVDKPVSSQSQATAAAAQPAAQTQPQVAAVTPQPPPQPPAPPAPPPAIKVGQTQDSVVAALGQPDSVDASGDKQVYIYKNVKVTFVNGKVSKVE